jgi:CBS domain-containing protein
MHQRIGEILDEKGTDVVRVGVDVKVIDAVTEMNRAKTGSVLVMDGDALAGIFTERDVLVRVVASGRSPQDTQVRDVMTPDPRSLTRTTTIAEAMGIMTRERKRHLPVLDGNRVVGLVSIGDVTKWMLRHLEQEVNDLAAYIGGPASVPPPSMNKA